jgi:paraquat-inducible protein B
MNDAAPGASPPPAPPAAIERHSRWPGWIWAIPIAALGIVAWLAFQQFVKSGPEVKVTFPTGGGIKAGDTKVQFDGMEVGEVDSVRFDKDMHHVDAVLQLHSDMAGHLGKGTLFWISGKPSIKDLASLKSVIAGPHIGLRPSKGPAQQHYVGLAEPPPDAGDVHAAHYVLRADTLGNLSRGSPVYYRDLQVGTVAGTKLDSDGHHFRIDVFINSPFDRLVHADTRFWDASAVQLAMAGSSPRLQLQSVPALFEGAVDFETPDEAAAGSPARPDQAFTLYESRDRAEHAPRASAIDYRVVFDSEEAGALDAGAPVTLDQKRIGTVTQSVLQYDPGSGHLDDLVSLAIEPSDISLAGATWASDPRPQMDALMRRLVAQGLRARLGSTIPVVGGKAVELVFVPNATAAGLGTGDVPQIPAGPDSGLNGIMAGMSNVAAKLDAMPLDQIGDNVHQITERLADLSKSQQLSESLHRLDDAVANLDRVTHDARAQAGPLLAELNRVADQAQSTVAAARGVIKSNPLGASQPGTAALGDTLYELGQAARSVRALADYLDRHPEALLRGKAGGG